MYINAYQAHPLSLQIVKQSVNPQTCPKFIQIFSLSTASMYIDTVPGSTSIQDLRNTVITSGNLVKVINSLVMSEEQGITLE